MCANELIAHDGMSRSCSLQMHRTEIEIYIFYIYIYIYIFVKDGRTFQVLDMLFRDSPAFAVDNGDLS